MASSWRLNCWELGFPQRILDPFSSPYGNDYFDFIAELVTPFNAGSHLITHIGGVHGVRNNVIWLTPVFARGGQLGVYTVVSAIGNRFPWNYDVLPDSPP